jgi:hypothetical protein
VPARQVLYHLSHTSGPFCYSYLRGKVLLFAQADLYCECPILHLLPYPRTTGMCHSIQLLVGMESHQTFCLDWPGTNVLLISASQCIFLKHINLMSGSSDSTPESKVARITSMSHRHSFSLF